MKLCDLSGLKSNQAHTKEVSPQDRIDLHIFNYLQEIGDHHLRAISIPIEAHPLLDWPILSDL